LQASAICRPNVESAHWRTSWGEAFSSVAFSDATSSLVRRFPGTIAMSTRIARRRFPVQRESLLLDARIVDLIPGDWSVRHDGNDDPPQAAAGLGPQPPLPGRMRPAVRPDRPLRGRLP